MKSCLVLCALFVFSVYSSGVEKTIAAYNGEATIAVRCVTQPEINQTFEDLTSIPIEKSTDAAQVVAAYNKAILSGSIDGLVSLGVTEDEGAKLRSLYKGTINRAQPSFSQLRVKGGIYIGAYLIVGSVLELESDTAIPFTNMLKRGGDGRYGFTTKLRIGNELLNFVAVPSTPSVENHPGMEWQNFAVGDDGRAVLSDAGAPHIVEVGVAIDILKVNALSAYKGEDLGIQFLLTCWQEFMSDSDQAAKKYWKPIRVADATTDMVIFGDLVIGANEIEIHSRLRTDVADIYFLRVSGSAEWTYQVVLHDGNGMFISDGVAAVSPMGNILDSGFIQRNFIK